MTKARGESRSAPVLATRRRQLLQLLSAFGGSVGMLDFQKLLFLFCQEAASGTPYDFVPYKFGAFSFTSYADRRKLIERGFLEDDEHRWTLTGEGRRAIGPTMDMPMSAFAQRYTKLRGDALVAHTYRRYPFFATRSEIAERVLQGDQEALANIASLNAVSTQYCMRGLRRL